METKQTQSENDDARSGEMLDRIRNRGTMVNKLIIDRDDLESIVEQRINRALIETFEVMVETIAPVRYDNPTNELVSDMLFDALDKLKN